MPLLGRDARCSSHSALRSSAAELLTPEVFNELEPIRRHSHSACAVGDTAILFGGQTTEGFSNDVVLLKPVQCVARRMETQGTSPQPRANHAATVVGHGGVHLLVSGGRSLEQVFGDIHILNMASLTWHVPISHRFDAPHTALLATRFSHTAVTIAVDRVAIFGGYGDNGRFCPARLQVRSAGPLDASSRSSYPSHPWPPLSRLARRVARRHGCHARCTRYAGHARHVRCIRCR